ncbi:2-C-methyl-D-erythritol 4-phosphate cytidylyltransferase [Lachnospiraceae bacterium 42-17]|jgi:2-C-methyl-D-erythritol 4-phosphate cytidylyltransferase|nr:2-C-methyl-D-erythritol 4-phosphate cytidylyltransferase [Dorea sp.]
MKEKMYCTAIVLSAGQGKRMETSTQKQYLELEGKPIIYYSLKVFEDSQIIDDIVLVVGEGQKEYVCEEILNKYGFSKVRAVVYGGKERYDSVWQGILALTAQQGYVFIHDGARPFVDEDILNRAYDTVIRHGACAAGMPSKDTIKLVDDESFTVKTPKRKYMWVVQTPQVFESSLITDAYSKLMREDSANVTDDAMVVEQMMKVPVKLFEGSYENIKITTPEDLEVASALLKRKNKNLGN